MAKHDPLLRIRFEGQAVGPGRISVPHLLRFLANFDKALQRSAMVLLGEGDSARRGARDRSARESLALDLVLLTEGSAAAVLGFDRKCIKQEFVEPDYGMQIIGSALRGLAIVQKPGEALPEGYDAGVLLAWRDAGVLFNQGIETIQFTLNHRGQPLMTSYTKEGLDRI